MLCELFESSQNSVLFCGPSNVLILLLDYVLLAVLLNFVFVVLDQENFANHLNFPYYLSGLFNIRLGGRSACFVLFIVGFCSPLFTIYSYDAS